MRVAELLDTEEIAYEMDLHQEAYTAGELASVEHIDRHRVVKPVMLEADGEKLMCAIPADRRLDLDGVRSVTGANRVRLLEEREMRDLCSDCELGAQPPIGRLFGLRTLLDSSLREDDWVLFQAGTHRAAIRMGENDFERIAQGQLGPISRA